MENTNFQTAAVVAPVQGVLGIPEIIFYQDINFGGPNFKAHADASYIGDQWNDQVSSFVITSGNWQFYKDAGFNTPCGNILGPGSYPWVETLGIPNDCISSFKCVSASNVLPTKSWNTAVTTPGVTALGGNISVVANNRGDWTFTGHMHDSGFNPYHFDLAAIILTPSGIAYTFTKSGHTEGTSSALPFGTPNRNCDWTNSGNNSSLKDNWSQVVNGQLSYKIATQDKTFGTIQDMLNSLIADAVKAAGQAAVKAIIGLI